MILEEKDYEGFEEIRIPGEIPPQEIVDVLGRLSNFHIHEKSREAAEVSRRVVGTKMDPSYEQGKPNVDCQKAERLCQSIFGISLQKYSGFPKRYFHR